MHHRLMALNHLLLVMTLLASCIVSAATAPQPAMNGYTLKQFAGFETNWRLVTVRYRTDTKEMRFTYANDLAWATLRAGKTDYPDGAVFAKIGVLTKPDQAFLSSQVPSGARRTQFMVRDKHKHAETDGWGYALFDADGHLFPGEIHAATLACAACHRLVPERGEVFSQIANLGGAFGATAETSTWMERVPFEEREVKTLPKTLQSQLPTSVRKVRVVKGDLTHHVFFGTLDEVRPTLTAEALRSGQPTLLISDDGKDYSVIFATGDNQNCDGKKGEVSLRNIHTTPVQTAPMYKSDFCQSAKTSD